MTFKQYKPWKAAERHAAKAVGGQRTPLSGSNSLITAGDVVHPKYYVEVKYRVRFAVLTLMRATEVLAKLEGKVAMVCLQERGSKQRYWIMSEKTMLELMKGRRNGR